MEGWVGLVEEKSSIPIVFLNAVKVGSVDKWLGRWKTSPHPRLIYGWHVTISWVRCLLWVNQPGQLSLPSLPVGKWVVNHVITWITGVETIKRQTRLCTAGWSRDSLWLQALPIGCSPSLSVTWTAPLQLRYAVCGAIQVLHAFVCAMWLCGLQESLIRLYSTFRCRSSTACSSECRWASADAKSGFRTPHSRLSAEMRFHSAVSSSTPGDSPTYYTSNRSSTRPRCIDRFRNLCTYANQVDGQRRLTIL